MKKEKTVKTHTRKLKSGKQVTVKQHTASYDAADVVADVLKKKGAGGELEQLKKKKAMKSEPVEKEDIYSEYGFTKDEFAEWYEGTGSKADKKVEKILRKAMGRKAYNELSDSAADNYKKGGANGFFKKSLKAMRETTGSKSDGDSSGVTRQEYNALYGNGGSFSSAREIEALDSRVNSKIKKYLGAKAYKEWCKYADSTDMEGAGSFSEFNKLLREFKEGRSADEPRKKMKETTSSDSSKITNWVEKMRAARNLRKMGKTEEAKKVERLLETQVGGILSAAQKRLISSQDQTDKLPKSFGEFAGKRIESLMTDKGTFAAKFRREYPEFCKAYSAEYKRRRAEREAKQAVKPTKRYKKDYELGPDGETHIVHKEVTSSQKPRRPRASKNLKADELREVEQLRNSIEKLTKTRDKYRMGTVGYGETQRKINGLRDRLNELGYGERVKKRY